MQQQAPAVSLQGLMVCRISIVLGAWRNLHLIHTPQFLPVPLVQCSSVLENDLTSSWPYSGIQLLHYMPYGHCCIAAVRWQSAWQHDKQTRLVVTMPWPSGNALAACRLTPHGTRCQMQPQMSDEGSADGLSSAPFGRAELLLQFNGDARQEFKPMAG